MIFSKEGFTHNFPIGGTSYTSHHPNQDWDSRNRPADKVLFHHQRALVCSGCRQSDIRANTRRSGTAMFRSGSSAARAGKLLDATAQCRESAQRAAIAERGGVRCTGAGKRTVPSCRRFARERARSVAPASGGGGWMYAGADDEAESAQNFFQRHGELRRR